MPRKKAEFPALRRHKPSKQGVVTLSGRDRYLGPWPDDVEDPPPAVRAEYDRLIAEWLAAGRPACEPRARPATPSADSPPSDALTVGELCVRFMHHAEQHYRRPDGSETNEVSEYRLSLRPLVHLYGKSPAGDFGPLKVKAVRELLVSGYDHPKHGPQPALARTLINHRIGRVVRMFKWAASDELVPAGVYHALKTVTGLQKGRSKARESEPVKPVAVAVVEATLPHMQPTPRAAARLQLLTGARAGELLTLKASDLVIGGTVWLYKVQAHKGSWRGKTKTIPIGPRGQEVIAPLLKRCCPICKTVDRAKWIGWRGTTCGPCADRLDEAGLCGPWPAGVLTETESDYHIFDPAEAVRELRSRQRSERKTKVQPSQKCRKKKNPKRKARDRYTVHSYDTAIARACKTAGVEHWSSHQLRHTAGTRIRATHGLEAAQILLGHEKADVTQLYAEKNLTLAVKLAAELG